MNLTREDMLRELELLPVWQLRTPPMLIAPPKEKKLVVLDEKIEAATEVPVNASVYTTSIAKNQEIIISDDKKWAFICSDSAHF